MPTRSLSGRAIALRKQAAAATQRIQELPPQHREMVQQVLDKVSSIADELASIARVDDPCARVRLVDQEPVEPLIMRLVAQQDRLKTEFDLPRQTVTGLAEEWSEELLAAYEELRVAQEELCLQNEELLLAHYQVETERQRYLDLFDFAPDGYLVTTLDGVVQAANRQAAELLNVKAGALAGKPLAAYVDRTDLSHLYQLLATLRDGMAKTWRSEIHLKARGGRVFAAELTIAPVTGANGQSTLQELRWIVRDVTGRKRAEDERERLLTRVQQEGRRVESLAQALQHEHDILLVIMENTQAHLAYLDPGLNLVQVNSAYARGAGYTKEELIGRNHFDLFPDQETQAIFERARDTGEAVSFHARPFSAPGRLRRETSYWDWSLVPVKDEKNQVQGLVLSLLDVTEEVLTAQAMHRSQQEFQALVEYAPDIIARFDRDLNLGYVNLAIEEYTNISRESLIGKTNRELGMADDMATLWEAELRAVFETGEQRKTQLVFPGQDGDWYFEARLAPEFGPDGTVQSLLAVVRNMTEHVRNLQALELERSRLKTVLDTAPEGILVVDAESRLIFSNPAAQDLYRRPLPYGQIYTSRGSLGLYHLDGRPYDPRDLPLTRAALDGETQHNKEMLIVWPDGQKRNLLVNAAPIRTSKGRVTGAVSTIQDITERMRITEILHRYAERLQVLRDVDRLILAAGSAQEIVALVLPRARQMLSCRHASVVLFDLRADVGRLLGVDAESETELIRGMEVPLPENWPMRELERGESFVNHEVCTAEHRSPLVRQLCGEGIQAVANLPLTASGKLLGALNLGLESDVWLTPDQLEVAGQLAVSLAIGIQQAQLRDQLRRRAEDLRVSVARRTAALQASEARFRTIFEDSATSMALLDADGRIIASNPALQELLGYSARELRTKTFDDLTHPDDAATGHALYKELLAGKRDHYNLEKRYLRRDGSTVWVRPTVSLVRRTRGGMQYAIKTIENVTEQRKAHEALVQAEKLTIAGQLGASMAHEINNPLQAVIGCLGLAEESLVEGGEVGLYLRIAREELRRAARIVSQLRDLHRPSDPGEREPTDVNDLLDQVLVLLRKQMETRRIEVDWEKTETPLQAHLVPDRVRQVFLNILLNAADAMAEGGLLQIETRLTENPEGVAVTFRDNGRGIEPDVLPHLFEPFFSTKPEGVGLGMFISRRIVNEHQGQIEVSSRPGRGTAIHIWLPAQPADGSSPGLKPVA